MNKKMLEINDALNSKTEWLRENIDALSAADIDGKLSELDELQKKLDTLQALEKKGVEDVKAKLAAGKMKEVGAETSEKKFADAARHGFKNQMSEGSDADGGYTVPEDIQTKINEYRDAKASLLGLVRRESVSTPTGSRTFKKRSQQTGFSKVGEGSAIGAKATPQFERISYEISKYAGYFPLTNELLADTDANITAVLTEWIGDESRVTANNLILEEIAKKEATKIEGIDGIKEVLNITLGSAFKTTSKIITNDNGLHYLDTLKDLDGRYLLAPSPSDTLQMRLAVGATFVPVVVIPNADLKNTEAYVATADTEVAAGKTYYTKSGEEYTEVFSPTKSALSNYYELESRVPFIIGDLNEGIYFFDRAQRSIMVSNIAAIGELNAFEQDLTIYRAIEREDVETRDPESFVNAYMVMA